jgi:ABC-type amino acid transport substrate-binding protein
MPDNHGMVGQIFYALITLILAMAWPMAGYAAPTTQKVLVIGTNEAPPFAIKDADGSWSGVAISLWKHVAQELGYQYTFRESTLEGTLKGVADHTFDGAIAAITITADREKNLDFTEPYYIAGLGIAVPNRQEAGWVRVTRQFFSIAFLRVVLGLTVLLLAAGMLVWLFERRRNAAQFGGPATRGIASSFWWAAVTMTTIGYGDKVPTTLGGRAVGLIWMFVSVIVISSFTAAITSSLTINRMQGPVQNPQDLSDVRVGARTGSTAADYLASRHIAFVGYTTAADALTALNAGELDAVVHDAPILRYEIKQQFHGHLRVLPDTFERQYYGIALPPNSPLREPLNRLILSRIYSPQWEELLKSYGID